MTPAGVVMEEIDPFELGFKECTLSDLRGGSAKENAETLMQV